MIGNKILLIAVVLLLYHTFARVSFPVITRKIAFTLAEVLITLAIIGVVAAMTIPSVLNHTKETQLKTGLKKAQSVLSEALQLMQEEEGIIATYDNYGRGGFFPVFKKYLSYMKDCGNTGCATQGSAGGYKTYNKSSDVVFQDFSNGQLILSDGMFLMIGDYTGRISLTIDVNGLSNKPNLFGHDLFNFTTDSDTGELIPTGHPDYSYSGDSYCSKTSTSPLNGMGCTYKALTEDDYFKNLP